MSGLVASIPSTQPYRIQPGTRMQAAGRARLCTLNRMETIMSQNLAAKFADDLTADIARMTDYGAPYGLTDLDGDNWTGEDADLDDFPNNSETEWQEASAMDYLTDVLDIQYLVNSDRSYRAARVCIALGGPTAWIDTNSGRLEVAWGSAPEYRVLPTEFIEGLDDACAELWEMGA